MNVVITLSSSSNEVAMVLYMVGTTTMTEREEA